MSNLLFNVSDFFYDFNASVENYFEVKSPDGNAVIPLTDKILQQHVNPKQIKEFQALIKACLVNNLQEFSKAENKSEYFTIRLREAEDQGIYNPENLLSLNINGNIADAVYSFWLANNKDGQPCIISGARQDAEGNEINLNQFPVVVEQQENDLGEMMTVWRVGLARIKMSTRQNDGKLIFFLNYNDTSLPLLVKFSSDEDWLQEELEQITTTEQLSSYLGKLGEGALAFKLVDLVRPYLDKNGKLTQKLIYEINEVTIQEPPKENPDYGQSARVKITPLQEGVIARTADDAKIYHEGTPKAVFAANNHNLFSSFGNPVKRALLEQAMLDSTKKVVLVITGANTRKPTEHVPVHQVLTLDVRSSHPLLALVGKPVQQQLTSSSVQSLSTANKPKFKAVSLAEARASLEPSVVDNQDDLELDRILF